MSVLLTAQSLSHSFGPRPLFEGVSLSIEDDARLGLIGPNGSGKSTLLKILAGRHTPDAGSLTLRKNLRASYVAQNDIFEPGDTPLMAVARALAESWTEPGVYVDHHDEHERETKAAVALAKVGFAKLDQPVEELSGGWRKRLAITQQIAREPELLMLDEPTNHLDMEGILWLEDLLDAAPFGVIVVTHDRYFLEESITRIVELNRIYPEGTFQVDGPYSEFLVRRADFLAAQAQQEQSLASKVRQDIAWLSRGAKARRTKAKGRIQESAQRMSELADLKDRNAPTKAAGIAFSATGRQTRKLLAAKNISKSLGDRALFSGLDMDLGPGDCLGLLGPNGSGKTTLINVLTGELAPDTGTIKRADDLSIVTFTQRRAELDRSVTLRDALSPEGDTVWYRGKAVHVASWAQRFLFRSDQLNVPVNNLSGGEQARIMIATLMRQTADILVLDEPTNDLDIPSLEVLEESLKEFPGAVVLVTHDRYMLDRLATQIVGLDGEGDAHIFASYLQWSAVQKAVNAPVATKPPPAHPPKKSADAPAKSKRLSYNEQREFAQMESKIHEAEAIAAELEKKVNEPAVAADHQKMRDAYTQLGEAQALVTKLYDRWAELEAKQS